MPGAHIVFVPNSGKTGIFPFFSVPGTGISVKLHWQETQGVVCYGKAGLMTSYSPVVIFQTTGPRPLLEAAKRSLLGTAEFILFPFLLLNYIHSFML